MTPSLITNKANRRRPTPSENAATKSHTGRDDQDVPASQVGARFPFQSLVSAANRGDHKKNNKRRASRVWTNPIGLPQSIPKKKVTRLQGDTV